MEACAHQVAIFRVIQLYWQVLFALWVSASWPRLSGAKHGAKLRRAATLLGALRSWGACDSGSGPAPGRHPGRRTSCSSRCGDTRAEARGVARG